jgi:hypothetical protein
MEYRGIPYTIRTGIERRQWVVVIHPQGFEVAPHKIFGARIYRKLFLLVCALEPKCLAVGTLIHIRQLPARLGLYLVGTKRSPRIRGVRVVNSAGKYTTLRLSEYISRGIEPPEYKTLPWQQDVAFRPADPKSE